MNRAAPPPPTETHLPTSKPDLRVGFVLLPQFTLVSFAGFLDVLRHAADDADRGCQIHCAWQIVAPALDPIISSGGVEVTPQARLGDPTRFDCVVVVGGPLSAPGQLPSATLTFLRRAHGAGRLIAGLGTGCFTLGAAGLLDGRRCSVHFRHAGEFRARFPTAEIAVHEIYQIDGNVATCPGGTAAIDLAVDIVSGYCGRSRATKGLADLVVDEHRATFHVPSHPFHDLECCGDERVEMATRLMRQDLSGKRSIGDLADTLHLTAGQLGRAFRAQTELTPAEVWRAMRLQHARWRLFNTSHSVSRIARECGFADAPHFIRWFRRVYGQTPQTARRERAAAHERNDGLLGDTEAFRRAADRRDIEPQGDLLENSRRGSESRRRTHVQGSVT